MLENSAFAGALEDVVAALEIGAEFEKELERAHEQAQELETRLTRVCAERDQFADLSSVEAAAWHAERLFGSRLRLLPSAIRSSKTSTFRRPRLVYETLAALALFGRSDRDLPACLHAACLPARWRPRDSTATVNTFPQSRRFTDSTGDERLFSRHLTMGSGGGAHACLQIYYEPASDGLVDVAWIGEHLPTFGRDA